jgi:plasmid maintenance system antidote protein VapI
MGVNIYYMKSNVTPIGEWIRKGLKDIGKSQVWLAEKIGVQPPQVSRIISGASETTPDILSAIADALGKPREQVYRVAGYLDKKPQKDEWLEEMTHKLGLVPPALRGVAGKFIDSMVEDEQEAQARGRKPSPGKKAI